MIYHNSLNLKRRWEKSEVEVLGKLPSSILLAVKCPELIQNTRVLTFLQGQYCCSAASVVLAVSGRRKMTKNGLFDCQYSATHHACIGSSHFDVMMSLVLHTLVYLLG